MQQHNHHQALACLISALDAGRKKKKKHMCNGTDEHEIIAPSRSHLSQLEHW